MGATTNNALMFLIDTVFSLYITVVLLRVLLPLVHADFRNPISQFIWRATATPVGYVSRVIPRWRNIDVPALVFALALCFVNIQIDMALVSAAFGAQPVLALLWSVLKIGVLICSFFTFTILIQTLMSWISPNQHSPATAMMFTLNEPLLRPVRSRLPALGGLDLSPLVVILALQVVSRLLPLPGLFR